MSVSAFEFKDLTILHRAGLMAGRYWLAGAGQGWRIRWLAGSEIAAREADAQAGWIGLGLQLGTGHSLVVYLPEGLFRLLLQGLELDQFWSLDPLLRCAYFQVNNQGVLDWVEQHWGLQLRVTTVDLQDVDPDYGSLAAFRLSTASGLTYQPGLADLTGVAQGQPLVTLFKRVPGAKTSVIEDIPLILDSIVGQTRVPSSELRELQRDDLILLEPDEFSITTARLCLQAKPLFLAEVGEHSLQVTQLLRSHAMTETDTPATGQPVVEQEVDATTRSDDETAPEAGSTDRSQARLDPDEIDVLVHFSLGTVTRTLAEIQDIGEGYVFELSQPAPRCVDIHVNGKRLAKGEPVKVEDRLGIRVVSVEGA